MKSIKWFQRSEAWSKPYWSQWRACLWFLGLDQMELLGFSVSAWAGSIPALQSWLGLLESQQYFLRNTGFKKSSFASVHRLWQNADFPYCYLTPLEPTGNLGMGCFFQRWLPTLRSRRLNLRTGILVSLGTAAAHLERQVTLKRCGCFFRTYAQHDVGHSCFQLSFSSQAQRSNLQYVGVLQVR